MPKGNLKSIKYTPAGPIPMTVHGAKKSITFSMDYDTSSLVPGSILQLSYSMETGVDVHIDKATASKPLQIAFGQFNIEIEFKDNNPVSGVRKNFTITITGKLDNQRSDTITIQY
jgi:hypothetical protein